MVSSTNRLNLDRLIDRINPEQIKDTREFSPGILRGGQASPEVLSAIRRQKSVHDLQKIHSNVSSDLTAIIERLSSQERTEVS